MTIIKLLSGTALLAAAGIALAQPGPGGPGMDRPDPNASETRQQVIDRTAEMFARMDLNHDGRVTPEEMRQLGEQRRGEMEQRRFARLDSNHDGNLSPQEFAQGDGPHGPHGPGPHGPPPPGGHEGGMAPPPPGGPDGGPGGPGGPGGGRMFERMFGAQGYVTLEQMRDRALARFDRSDANHDGVVTADERRAAREQMRQRLEARQPG